MMSADPSSILSLSDETLLMIFKYIHSSLYDKNSSSSTLATRDLIRLSQTCSKFRQLTEDKELCRRFAFSWSVEEGAVVSFLSFVHFFKDTPRAGWVTSLDVTDAYWIPSELLKDVAVQMVNLKELRTAGVDLWYSDLIAILKETHNLQKLSWSWDYNFEVETKKVHPNAPFDPKCPLLEELVSTSACQTSIKSLLIDIPMPKALEGATSREMDEVAVNYSSLAYFISKCSNLEEIWLLSWPRTRGERLTRPHWPTPIAGRNFSSDHLFEGIPQERFIKLDKLKKMFVFGGSTRGYSRFGCDRMVRQLKLSIVENNGGAEMLWIDHPSLSMTISKTDAYTSQMVRPESEIYQHHSQIVPLSAIGNCERLSFSFWPYFSWSCRQVPIPSACTHLLISQTDLRNDIVNVLPFGVTESNVKSFYANSCPCSMMDLNLFVSIHPNLEEICIPSFIQGMGEYCVQFSRLEKLKRICLPVDCLLKIQNREAVESYRRRKGLSCTEDSEQDTTATPCGIDLLVSGCPLVEEVEIGFDRVPPRVPADVSEDLFANSISGIVEWSNLQKLTLVRIPILKAEDFTNICSNCTNLESLRLTHIGTPGGLFFKHLISKSLPHCKNLKDLRLEQDMIGPPSTIITAISHCPKLRRCLIWSSRNYHSLTKTPVLQLFRTCPNLVVFYASIDTTKVTTCLQITQAIESEFKQKRKSLSVIIRGGLDGEIIRYPSVHYRELVDNEPQVCQPDLSQF